MTKMMRITKYTAEKLEELVKILGKSKQSIMESAVEKYLREKFLEKTVAEYETIKANREASAAENIELSECDQTLEDGMEDYD